MTQRQLKTKAIETLKLLKVAYTEADVLFLAAILSSVHCLGEVSGLQKAAQIVREEV